MKHSLIILLSLMMGGCWGQIPLHNQFDFQESESEYESQVAYSDEEIYSMVEEFPAMEMFDKDMRDNNNVGLTSFCCEDGFAR